MSRITPKVLEEALHASVDPFAAERDAVTLELYASLIEGGQELSSYPARCRLALERRTALEVSGEEAEKFCQEISKLNLAEVIENMTVYEQITKRQIDAGSTDTTIRKKMYTIRMEFYPKHEYKEEFNIVPKNIEDAIELNFIGYLESSIKKEAKSAINTIGIG